MVIRAVEKRGKGDRECVDGSVRLTEKATLECIPDRLKRTGHEDIWGMRFLGSGKQLVQRH